MRLPFLPLLLAAAVVLRAGKAERTLDIFWCDSEGGGSTLIVTPAGESVLVDSGNPGGRDSGRILHVLTNVAGLSRLDHLVVTHLHIDHFGGAAEIAAAVPVAHLWDNGLPDTDPDGGADARWRLTSRPYREMRVGERHRVEPGTRLPLASGDTPLRMRCLITRRQPAPVEGAPRPADGPKPTEKAHDTSDNANSSAWLVEFGAFRFFDAGDLTWNVEASLVWPEIRVPEVDVYQVTHHGLDVSNHPRLLAALNPAVSVMNNGPTKGTAGEVLATLRALPGLQAQYQLHRNARPDGATNNCPHDFIANPSRPEGRTIRCSVSPDGRRYRVSLPGSGVARGYAVRR